MNLEKLKFRLECKEDHREVEELTREAFWNWFVPGCDEHYLVHVLRDADCFIPELNIVAELDNKIVANIMYSKSKIKCDDGSEYPILTFGPVSVLPEYHKRGIGSRIIEYSKTLAKDMGYEAIIIYGDPNYYSRVGFEAAEKYDIASAENTYISSLQVCELVERALENVSGIFIEDKAFEIDANEAEEFDKEFKPKKKIEGIKMQNRFKELIGTHKPRA